VEHARKKYGVSERQACRVLKQGRGTQRYQTAHRTDEDALTQAIIALASEYGRYRYRRITAKLREAGWAVGKLFPNCSSSHQNWEQKWGMRVRVRPCR
jgi:putative transposase